MSIVKYNLKLVIKNRFFKYIIWGILLLVFMNLYDFQLNHSNASYTFLEATIYNLSDNNIITWIIIPISLYYMNNIFYDEEFKNYIAIRANTKHNLFKQKVMSAFLCNSMFVFIFFIISLIASLFIFRISFDWTKIQVPKAVPFDEIKDIEVALRELSLQTFPTQRYFSMIVSILVILLLLIFGLTLLSLIFCLVSNIINNFRIGSVIGFVYFMCSSRYIYIGSKQFEFLKYFTIDSFVLVNNHAFGNNNITLYSLNQSFLLLFILLIIFYFLNLLVLKKTDASRGE